jgi:tRNA(Leu) C34 or U34 (ribose-2'-O)-methylase TrmL
MKNFDKMELDFTDQIKAMQEAEAGSLDRVSNYIFTNKEAAADKAREIGFVADNGKSLFHALQYRDMVVFMPGKNSKDFHQWFWDSHSSEK